MKKYLTVVMIMFVASAALFAGGIRWKLVSPGTNYLRFKQTEDPNEYWTIVSQNGQDSVYVLVEWDGPIYLAASYDGEHWGEASLTYPQKKSSSKNQVSEMVSPFAYEGIRYLSDGSFLSTSYGFGFEVSGVHIYGNGIRTGAELAVNTYSLKSSTVDHLSEVMLGICIGSQVGDGILCGYYDFVAGITIASADHVTLAYGYAGMKVGVEYFMSESISFKGQVCGRVAYQPEGSVSAGLNLIVTPSVGVGYTY